MPSYASDGDRDGGGPGAEYLGCQLGTEPPTAPLRVRRLRRPALPASSAHLRRDQLGFRRRLRRSDDAGRRLGVPPRGVLCVKL